MRTLLLPLLLASCATRDLPPGGDGTITPAPDNGPTGNPPAGSCDAKWDHLGEEFNGSCNQPEATCSYSTSEWDFQCSCVAPENVWHCCSAEQVNWGCPSQPPADGSLCCARDSNYEGCDYPGLNCECLGSDDSHRRWSCVFVDPDLAEPSPVDLARPVDLAGPADGGI